LLEFKTLEAIYIVIDDIGNQYNTISSESQKILKGKTLEKFIEGRKNAFLSQKLATLDCNVEMSYFNLEDFSFNPKEIQTPEVFSFFEELEFHSLLDNRVYKYDTWESTGKQVKIIGDEL
jgi:5'-3' exonuclease